MKKILLVVSVLFLFSFTACDDNGNGSCNFDEFIESFANTDCPAEELVVGCTNTSCSSRDPDINDRDLRSCTIIDCETLSCEDIRVGFEDPQPGLMTNIAVDEMTGRPIGIFEVDGLEGEFNCTIGIP